MKRLKICCSIKWFEEMLGLAQFNGEVVCAYVRDANDQIEIGLVVPDNLVPEVEVSVDIRQIGDALANPEKYLTNSSPYGSTRGTYPER